MSQRFSEMEYLPNCIWAVELKIAIFYQQPLGTVVGKDSLANTSLSPYKERMGLFSAIRTYFVCLVSTPLSRFPLPDCVQRRILFVLASRKLAGPLLTDFSAFPHGPLVAQAGGVDQAKVIAEFGTSLHLANFPDRTQMGNERRRKGTVQALRRVGDVATRDVVLV